MRESKSWYALKIFAAAVTAVVILAALAYGNTVAVIPGIWAIMALCLTIYADWRQRLETAQEEWDAYMAELRQLDDQEADAAQSVEDARNQLFREFAGSYYGTH